MSVIDTYLQDVTPAQRAALERIRSLVKRMVPQAEEAIRYGIPTLLYNQKPIIHFAAFKDHMSVFPTGDSSLDALDKQLHQFRTSKGTLQFTEKTPIPDSLIKAIVEIRLQSIANKASIKNEHA